MSVLVDSSVWIQYLRGNGGDDRVDWLIDEGMICTNELILAELLPPLIVRKQFKLVGLLREIPKLPFIIDWPGIEQAQCACIRKGVNRVGIPDLIIAQNATQNSIPVLSYDRHFVLMAKVLEFELF